eukprot:5442094-Alexandrium_andersonii.AAC.1
MGVIIKVDFFGAVRSHPGRGPLPHEAVCETTPKCEQRGKVFKSMCAKKALTLRHLPPLPQTPYE